MPKKIDETGNRYGRLTVLREYPSKDSIGTWWVCRCDCGNEVAVRGIMLRANNTRSCGCLRKMSIEDKIEQGLWNPTNQRSQKWGGGFTGSKLLKEV